MTQYGTEAWRSWHIHPCTTEFVKNLKKDRDDKNAELGGGADFNPDSIDSTVLLYVKGVGYSTALTDKLEEIEDLVNGVS